MKGNKVEMLFLSEPDMIEAGVLDIKKCVHVIDDMFRLIGKGDYLMGGPNKNDHGLMLWFPKTTEFENMPVAGPDRRFMAMPAYLGGDVNICGQKWYGSNIINPTRGLPRSILTVQLNDTDTGEPRVLMSANLLSAMRTGAVPGVAAKYLERDGAESIGIVGCGVISRACLMAIAEGMKTPKKVYLYDIFREKAEAFAVEMGEKTGLEMVITDSLKECIVDSDVISIAAAGAVKVEIDKDWLKPGSLLTLTGACQLSKECYTENKLVCDNWTMHKAWYSEAMSHPDGFASIVDWAPSAAILMLYHEGIYKDGDIPSLGDIAMGKVSPRKDNDEKIIFFTGGMPIEDVAWGYACYKEALDKGIGTKLKLWDEPHWF